MGITIGPPPHRSIAQPHAAQRTKRMHKLRIVLGRNPEDNREPHRPIRRLRLERNLRRRPPRLKRRMVPAKGLAESEIAAQKETSTKSPTAALVNAIGVEVCSAARPHEIDPSARPPRNVIRSVTSARAYRHAETASCTETLIVDIVLVHADPERDQRSDDRPGNIAREHPESAALQLYSVGAARI